MTDLMTMGAKRSQTMRNNAAKRAHAALESLRINGPVRMTPKVFCTTAGIGMHMMNVLMDDDDVIKEAIANKEIVPSNRGRLPDWATDDITGDDRITTSDAKQVMVQSFLDDPDLDTSGFPENFREDFIKTVQKQVNLAYGSNAVKTLKERLLEQIGTYHQARADVIERDQTVLLLAGKVTEVETKMKTMEQRMDDRLDHILRLLPAPPRRNGRSATPSTPPPVGDTETGLIDAEEVQQPV